MSLTQRDYSQAYESGKAARRGRKRIGDVPYRGKTDRVRLLAEAWCNGFRDQDDEGMTPFEISILLHYNSSPGDFRNGDFSAPILKPTLERFVEIGLLRRAEFVEGRVYAKTDATGVYIEALCAVPAPVQKWVIPEVGA